MPFITEEIWQTLQQRLPREGELPDSIMVAQYPASDQGRIDQQADQEMLILTTLIRAIRNARAQLRIPSGQPLEAVVDADGMRSVVHEESQAISSLARVKPLRILEDTDARPPAGQVMTLVVDPVVVMLPLVGVVDIAAERRRMEAEVSDCVASLDRVQRLLDNGDFTSRAPEEVVEREQERLLSLKERHSRLQEVLCQFPS